MSGNSSVCRLSSDAQPKATRATIAVTVMIGRLIAKSEMNMSRSCAPVRRLAGARRPIAGGGNAKLRSRREPLRGAREQRIARAHASAKLHLIRRVVADAELHRNALHHPFPDAEH